MTWWLMNGVTPQAGNGVGRIHGLSQYRNNRYAAYYPIIWHGSFFSHFMRFAGMYDELIYIWLVSLFDFNVTTFVLPTSKNSVPTSKISIPTFYAHAQSIALIKELVWEFVSVSVYVWVCMCICVYVCVYIYIVYMYMYAYVYFYVYV